MACSVFISTKDVVMLTEHFVLSHIAVTPKVRDQTCLTLLNGYIKGIMRRGFCLSSASPVCVTVCIKGDSIRTSVGL